MMPEPKISHFSSEKMVLKNVLLRIWGSILKKKIHEQHSFFQQGGHSLLALNLLYQIQNEWSLQLHLSDLLIYDSIVLQTDWLYQKINQNKSSSNIYILKEYPEEPTYDWVLIHPILGDLACYAYWVKQCSDAAQVMGVSCPHHIENYANANDLLVEYAEAIIKQLKTNRVRLLGYSFGGMLAVLLAPFLSKKEISVEWVGIIDSDLSTDFSDLLSKSAYSLDTNNMHAEVIEHFYQKAKERGVIDYDYPYHAFQSRALSMYHLYRLFSGVSLKPLETPWFMVLGLKTHQVSMMQYSPFLAAPTLILEATHADMLSEINSQKILDFIATL